MNIYVYYVYAAEVCVCGGVHSDSAKKGFRVNLHPTGQLAPWPTREASQAGPCGVYISNPAAADAGRQYLPGGMGSPHPPAKQASHPGRPLIIISVSA